MSLINEYRATEEAFKFQFGLQFVVLGQILQTGLELFDGRVLQVAA